MNFFEFILTVLLDFLKEVGYDSRGGWDEVCWFLGSLPLKWREVEWFGSEFDDEWLIMGFFGDELFEGMVFDVVDVDVYFL